MSDFIEGWSYYREIYIWKLQDWWTFHWPQVFVGVAIVVIVALAFVVHRREFKKHTLTWFTLFLCVFAGIVLGVLAWAERYPMDKALIMFLIIAAGEMGLAYFCRWRESPSKSVTEDEVRE